MTGGEDLCIFRRLRLHQPTGHHLEARVRADLRHLFLSPQFSCCKWAFSGGAGCLAFGPPDDLFHRTAISRTRPCCPLAVYFSPTTNQTVVLCWRFSFTVSFINLLPFTSFPTFIGRVPLVWVRFCMTVRPLNSLSLLDPLTRWPVTSTEQKFDFVWLLDPLTRLPVTSTEVYLDSRLSLILYDC